MEGDIIIDGVCVCVCEREREREREMELVTLCDIFVLAMEMLR